MTDHADFAPETTAPERNETATKSRKPTLILPLITVWLQVERFPNRQLNRLCFGSEH
jgi:hypothetical protein